MAISYIGYRPASEMASRSMRANKAKDTRHEVLLRQELFRLGLRYRKNVSSLPGKPDLVFRRARVVVFCDGDFWHGRNWGRLRTQLKRRHNSKYWLAKIAANIKRDLRNTELLEEQGWFVIRLWEAEITRSPTRAALAITRALKKRQEHDVPGFGFAQTRK